jgi:hypothetical protein
MNNHTPIAVNEGDVPPVRYSVRDYVELFCRWSVLAWLGWPTILFMFGCFQAPSECPGWVWGAALMLMLATQVAWSAGMLAGGYWLMSQWIHAVTC